MSGLVHVFKESETITPTAAHTVESERLGRVEQTRLYGRNLYAEWALKL